MWRCIFTESQSQPSIEGLGPIRCEYCIILSAPGVTMQFWHKWLPSAQPWQHAMDKSFLNESRIILEKVVPIHPILLLSFYIYNINSLGNWYYTSNPSLSNQMHFCCFPFFRVKQELALRVIWEVSDVSLTSHYRTLRRNIASLCGIVIAYYILWDADMTP